jgi:hypothetical protein
VADFLNEGIFSVKCLLKAVKTQAFEPCFVLEGVFEVELVGGRITSESESDLDRPLLDAVKRCKLNWKFVLCLQESSVYNLMKM